MTIIYWLLGALLAANIITIVGLIDLRKEYNDSLDTNKLIVELWKNNNSQMDRMYKVHNDIYDQYKDILESYRLMNSIHEKIYEEYKSLKEQYKEIISNNAELLTYCESIENRYSDCYEQLVMINGKLDSTITNK